MILDIIQLFTGFYLLVGLFTMMMLSERIVEIIENACKDSHSPVMELWTGLYLTVGYVLAWPWLMGKKK